MVKFVEEYNKKHGTNFVYDEGSWATNSEVLMSRVQGGVPPDMANIGPLEVGYVLGGNALAIDELVRASSYFGDLSEVAKMSSQWKGEYVASPDYIFPAVVAYRTDWLTEKGIDPPTNWNELVKVAKALTEDTDGDGEIDRWGWTINGERTDYYEQFANYLYPAGASAWIFEDGKYKSGFDKPETVNAFKFYTELFTKWHVVPPDSPTITGEDIIMRFAAGKVAFAVLMPWNVGTLWDAAPELKEAGKIGWTLFPTNITNSRYAMVEHTMYFNPDTVEECFKFSEDFFWSHESGIEMAFAAAMINPTPAVADDPRVQADPALKLIADASKTAQTDLPVPGFDAINYDVIGKWGAKALAGEITPEDAATEIHKGIQTIFEQYGIG
jgi:multiple sugar transport system substrate-binding protein